MTEPFDPYRKWLGIPPQDQPPNHYRLLGLELFESDPDVIGNAADGRMAQIKNFQAGKYSGLSQRLLNEIAAARVCLLNESMKADYDRRLRQQLEGRAGGAAPAVPPPLENRSDNPAEFMPRLETASAPLYLQQRRSKRSPWPNVLVLFGLLALAGVLFFAIRKDVSDGTKQRDSSPPIETLNVATDRPSVEKHASETPPKGPPLEKRSASAEEEAIAVESKPEAPNESKVVEADVVLPDLASLKLPEAEEQPREDSDVEAPLPDAGRKKHPVPDAAQQEAAEAEIRGLFAKEFAGRGKDDKLDLAAKLIKQADEAGDEDVVARYVFLKLAIDAAASAGALNEALDAIDAMGQSYDMNPLGMKAEVLARVVELSRSSGWELAGPKDILVAALELIDTAVSADDYEIAVRIGKLAVSVARAAKDPQTLRDVSARVREVDRLKLRFSQIQSAVETLAANPDDAEANLTAGQWYCFAKGDWQKGLPLLRKGSDGDLAVLAADDLTAPDDAKSQLDLADRWWNVADKEQGPSKALVQGRAVHWYQSAVPHLSGLDKAKAEKRIASVQAESSAPAPRPSRVRGVVEKGNVALASNGATVEGLIDHAERLLDGNVITDATGKGITNAQVGQPFTVTLPKVYILREIRIYLWDGRPRSYNYAVAVSSNGKDFTPLVDRSQGNWTGWQRITFAPQSIKSIKVFPLRRDILDKSPSNPKLFTLIELEAYCVPPDNR